MLQFRGNRRHEIVIVGRQRMRMLRAAYRLMRLVLHFLFGFAVAAVLPAVSLRARRALLSWWARGVLAAVGVRMNLSGAPRVEPGLIVANHVSWLDVLAICAARPALFVSKSEIGGWPAIGWLLRRAGTLFIERRSFRGVWRLNLQIRARFIEGETVAAFPESTTTAGDDVLAFRSGLFQPAVERALPVYPMAIAYSSDAAAFIGDMTFIESLLAVACARDLTVHIAALAPLPTRGLKRREVADRACNAIRARLLGLQLYAGARTFSKISVASRSLSGRPA
jgi:1-acyl-sn-glycerol-3-phosphate acyltransferase